MQNIASAWHVVMAALLGVFCPAGMYIWAALPEGLSVNDLEFCQQLVAATGIAISPGRGFGPGGVNYVRFALVQPEAVLMQAAEVVGQFAKSLQEAHAAREAAGTSGDT